MKAIWQDEFYKKVIKIGTPMALAQLATSLLGIIDTFMVERLGEQAVAAVGIGVNFMFLVIMILFGFFSGLSIFMAQYWGSKDIGNIHKVFIVTLFIGVIVSSTFFVLGFFFTDQIIDLYNNTSNMADYNLVQEYGVQYLKIAAFTYFTMTFSFAIQMLMRSVEKVLYPQVISIFMVILNTVLNYLLIFGNFGFPELGVEGAAIATFTSSFMGFLFLVGRMVFSRFEVYRIQFAKYKEITKEFVKKLMKKAMPVAINEAIWGLGMSMYLIAFGFISTNATASVHITNQVMGLFWAINAGISGSSAIILGNKLGENDLDTAKKWGNKFIRLVFMAGVTFGVLLFILSGSIASIFSRADIQDSVILILRVFSFYVPVKFMNALHIIGTLRSGGDTRFALFAEIGPLWLIGVPLAFILSIYTSLPLYLVVLFVNIEEVVKLSILTPRYFTYKWVQNLTID